MVCRHLPSVSGSVDVVGNNSYWLDHTVHLATIVWSQDGGIFLALDVQCCWPDLDCELDLGLWPVMSR